MRKSTAASSAECWPRAAASRKHALGDGSGPAAPPSVFISFDDGMEVLVAALLGRLEGDLRLETGVERLEQARRAATGWR